MIKMPVHNRISMIGRQITARATQFVRLNPLVSGAALGGSILAGGTIIRQIGRRRKNARRLKRPRVRRRKAKGRRKGHRRAKRRVVRGRGLGRREIHHGHKGNKVVSFRTKSGKLVRFKTKGTATRHRRKRRR